MTEQELYNEYRKSDCKSFTDFLINKIKKLKKTYRKQCNKRIDELQKENAELKEKLEVVIALKDEEMGCIETDFNTFKSKSKEHIKKLLDCLKQDTNDPQTNYYVCQYMDKAEQFIKDSEVNNALS